jgi:hypothetical protein
MVIKFPVDALGLVVVELLEVLQLVKSAANSTTPITFASLIWGVNLKGLLKFSLGITLGHGSLGVPG